MSLLKLIEPSLPTYLLPELQNAILQEIRSRYRAQISPQLWKIHFDIEHSGSFSQEFIDQSFQIVAQVLADFTDAGKLARLLPRQLDFVEHSLWEKSQAYWYEYAPELDSVLSFIDRIFQNAREEMHGLFPAIERVFGEMATNLLVDLAFQYEFYRFSKIAKPDMIDLRRIINLSGQVIESISSVKLFPGEDLRLGRILDRLSKSRGSSEPLSPLVPNIAILQSHTFLSDLDTLNKIRNKYSHGTADQGLIEDDFETCIDALLRDDKGILRMIYDVLKDAGN